MSLTVGLALALNAIIGVTPMSAASLNQTMPQAQTIKEYVQTYFADEPIMVAIAECESHFRQYGKDGSVFRNVLNANGTYDIGIMQINSIWVDKAAKLGLDLSTIQGNLAFGRYLYDAQGSTPWNSSKPCWGNQVTQNAGLALK